MNEDEAVQSEIDDLEAARQLEQVKQDTAQLRKEEKRLTAHNNSEVEAIAAFGGEVDPASVTRIRLDAFIDFMFGRLGGVVPEVRELMRMQFEVAFETKIASELEGIKAEVRKMQLGMGANIPQSVIAKAWRAQQNGNGGGSGPKPGPGGLITP
jgi:hypothetical protein